MAFCGQCGYLLPQDRNLCPRCGATTEPEYPLLRAHPSEEHLPTVASAGQSPIDAEYRVIPAQQPQLVLNAGPEAYAANAEPTRRNSSPERLPQPYQQPISSAAQDIYVGSPQTPAYYPTPGPFTAEPAPRRGGRTALIVVLCLILLLLLSGGTLFALQYAGVINLGVGPGVPATQTPAQQAQSVVQNYYGLINQRNYQAAYGLWYQKPSTYDAFAKGYANTQHDDITIDHVAQLPDGTIEVDITIHATEQGTAGTVQSTYLGSYILGQRTNSWLFLSGQFQRAPA